MLSLPTEVRVFVFCYCCYRIAPRPRAGAVILIAVFTPRIAVDATEGFGFLGAVVDEDGTINHTL